MLKNNILSLLIGIYLITALLGYQIGWSAFQYDELRLLQFPLALCALLILIFAKKIEYSIYTQTIFFIIGILISIQQINWNIYQFQELWSAIALLFILSILVFELKGKTYLQHVIALIIVSALIPCLFILISIIKFIFSKQWYDWQFNSGTIRIYDSVIVPLFFFLIFLKNNKYPYIDYFYPITIFFFSLAWFFDGARSALFAIITGLIIFFLLSKKNHKLVLKIFLYMFSAFIVFKGTAYFADKNTMTVMRSGTSLRAEMWHFVFEQWKKYPFSGLGGGYLSRIQYQYGHHIHNLYLRLIFEWGAIGCIFLVWMTYQLVKLFLNKGSLPIAKAGVAAILIDAMFSGNMVYPTSQIACIFFIAFAFSQRKVASSSQFSFLSTKVLISLWGTLFLYITIMYLGQDLMCWGCSSYVGRMAPNFWEYGGTEHLIPTTQIP